MLGTLYYGGYLLSNQRVTPGDLMSFLVATQTIQRSLQQMSLLFGQIIKGIEFYALYLTIWMKIKSHIILIRRYYYTIKI